jgi:hypothetical protein
MAMLVVVQGDDFMKKLPFQRISFGVQQKEKCVSRGAGLISPNSELFPTRPKRV